MKLPHIAEEIALSDSGFLFIPSSGESFTLNEIGKEIIGLIKQGMNESEIKEYLLKEYDVNEKDIQKDLDDFIHQLISFKIIK